MNGVFCAVALGAAGWCLSANAAPLKRADVSATAAWVVQVDCDGLRPTAIGQEILSQMDQPEVQNKLAAFQTLFGFDLRQQLHGLTLYGPDSTPANGVLLVYADFDPDRLLTLAKAADSFQSTNYNQHAIYNWLDDKKKSHDGARPRVFAAIQGPRVIFGQRQAAVASALDVLDGATPSLASGNVFPQLGTPAATAFIQAAASKLNIPGDDPHAAIFRWSKVVSLDIADTQQQVTATLNLQTDNEEVAGHIAAIAQGLVALAKLQTNQPVATAIANALVFKQDGANFVVTLTLPDSQAIQVMATEQARKAQKKKQDD